MCHKHSQGFAIIAAIFLLVVLVTLGIFIASISSMHSAGSAADVMGARVYQAARSGTEWGISQAINNDSCAASTDLGAIDSMTVTVTCTIAASGNTTEAGLGKIYSITATACNIPTGSACPGSISSANYVERSLTAMVEN